MEEMEETSRENLSLKVNVCVDYSGEWDIAQSCMKVMKQRMLQTLVDDNVAAEESVESVMHGSIEVCLVIRYCRQFINWRFSCRCADSNWRGVPNQQFSALADRVCRNLCHGRVLARLHI